MVRINGVDVCADGKSLAAYLEENDLILKKTTGYIIAVERNGEIVPKAKYEETILADGDKIEIVSFVGGG